MEEKKAIIAEAGIELTDDELKNVSGGIIPEERLAAVACPNCGFINPFHIQDKSFTCENCGETFVLCS